MRGLRYAAIATLAASLTLIPARPAEGIEEIVERQSASKENLSQALIEKLKANFDAFWKNCGGAGACVNAQENGVSVSLFYPGEMERAGVEVYVQEKAPTNPDTASDKEESFALKPYIGGRLTGKMLPKERYPLRITLHGDKPPAINNGFPEFEESIEDGDLDGNPDFYSIFANGTYIEAPVPGRKNQFNKKVREKWERGLRLLIDKVNEAPVK